MSRDVPPPQSVLAFARNDPGRARALTDALVVLRDRGDRATREAIDDVLRGRTTFREMLRTPAGAALLRQGSQAAVRQWESWSPEQRDKLAQEGRRRLDQGREEPPAATPTR